MATTPKNSPERTKQQSLAYGRNLVVLACLIFLPGLWGAIHGALTLRRPRADATIIDANLRTFARESSDTRFGGIDFFGGRVEPYDFGMQNSAGAQRMRDRHPVGSVAKIAYDTADANVAYLEPGPSSFSLAMVGIGIVIGASGLWVRSLARRGIGRMET